MTNKDWNQCHYCDEYRYRIEQMEKELQTMQSIIHDANQAIWDLTQELNQGHTGVEEVLEDQQ